MDRDDREAVIKTFLVESGENLSRMEEGLIALEARPEEEETLQAIFRMAHTLKGNAACLEFQEVTEFAHAVEEVLGRLRNRTMSVTSDLITVLLRAVDILRQMVPDAVAGIQSADPKRTALLRELAATTTGSRKGEVKAAAEAAPSVDTPDSRQRPCGRRASDAQAWTERTKGIWVDLARLDRIIDLAGEMAIAQERVRQLMEGKEGLVGEERLEATGVAKTIFMELQEEILKIRMVPVGPMLRQYVRTVRDLALAAGKSARLDIQGEDVEVDTTVIEHLKDPLTHMIRNAVDHGIELPEKRKAAGKDPCGCLTLRASHEAGTIVIELEDDGAGFQRKRILEKAVSKGLISDAQRLTDAETYRLVFEPGFSTAESVSDLSGRGVGMDVVRRNIDDLRGSISVRSQEGVGATITIQLPLTLAIIEGFAAGVGDETYVIPLDAVLECLELPQTEAGRSGGTGVINLRGKVLPCLRLRELFHLGHAAPGRENIIVVKHGRDQMGLVVDDLYGESQVVIKSLGTLFQQLPGISGSTILGNGRVALILDIPTLMREIVGRAERGREVVTASTIREGAEP